MPSVPSEQKSWFTNDRSWRSITKIIGKSFASILKSDVKQAVGSLQVSTGQDAGCEAAVHAIHCIFDQDD